MVRNIVPLLYIVCCGIYKETAELALRGFFIETMSPLKLPLLMQQERLLRQQKHLLRLDL